MNLPAIFNFHIFHSMNSNTYYHIHVIKTGRRGQGAQWYPKWIVIKWEEATSPVRRFAKDLSSPGDMPACYFYQWQHWVCPEPGTYLGRGDWRLMTSHLKAIWGTHLETRPSRYLSVLINLGIWANCSSFSKSCKNRGSYALIKTPCMAWRAYSTTSGY